MAPETLFTMRLDDEDRALLEACVAREKLSKSDIMRRALRAYAETIGAKPAEVKKPRRPKPKR
ncbi:MAG: ribbon-helix-helix protein, CopG family [Myxococcales bacterium]|nr:ribbon-helix-helix protein, CopG family [Myxococcales bacterium]